VATLPEALERWRVLPAGSPRAAVGELGIDVEKVEAFLTLADTVARRYGTE
jgi:hypothetical protein